jgi:5-methylcytosine-specific restriction protein A
MKRPRITMLKPRIATLDTRTAKPLPKEVDSHYNTPEHRAWALAVKRRGGWRCEHVENGVRCPNRHPTSVMYAGHIKNRIDYPELALDPKNGRCECNSHNTKGGIQDRVRRMAEKP